MVNQPHTCPVCGGQGIVASGNAASPPFTRQCKPCNGLGAIWGPHGAENNWTDSYIPEPIKPFIYSHPGQSLVDIEKLNEILGDFRKSMDDHMETSEENNAKEIFNIINDPVRKRFIL